MRSPARRTHQLRIPPQNIEFALDAVSEEEKKPINIRLEQLTKASILYNNNGVYELMRSDRKDIQQLIKQYKADPIIVLRICTIASWTSVR